MGKAHRKKNLQNVSHEGATFLKTWKKILFIMYICAILFEKHYN